MFKNTNAFSSFSVNDLSKAEQFYGQTLGLTVDKDKKMGILHLHLHGGGEVMIYPKDNHIAATYTALNFLVKDIEVIVDELIAKGIVFEQYEYLKTNEKGIVKGGDAEPSIAWFKDPAGNILSVIEEK